MEKALGDSVILHLGGLGLVIRIRVQSLVGNNMVFQESLEILLTIFAEQEAIDPGTKFLEGKI